MLRGLFSNRLFIGGLAFFIFCVGGSLLYMQHVERETAREMAAHEEHIKQLTEKPKPKPKPTTVEAPVGEPPQQDGHVHEDGTFQAEPHEMPPATASHSTDSLMSDETTDILTSVEREELYGILRTEGFKREKLSEKQLLYLSKVGLHWDYLSPQQQRQLEEERYAEHGLNPPPEGYRYSFQDVHKGILNLDEKGNAIIVKIDDPSIKKSFGGHLLDVSK